MKRTEVEKVLATMSVVRQCGLLELSRSTFYYQPVGEDAYNLALMRRIDEQFTKRPFYGVPRMTASLRMMGYGVNPKRVRRLMRVMGLEAIYPKPRLSANGPDHKVYPYLLKEVTVDRPDQAWATDITYVRLTQGFVYLIAVLDWYSRYVVSWELSTTLDTGFCLEALRRALRISEAGDFQHGPGSAVHERGFHGSSGKRRDQGEHGRTRAGVRQHLRRTALALGQVRGGLTSRLPDGPGGEDTSFRLFRVLQQRATA